MTDVDSAIRLEIEDDLLGAADAYEELIANSDAPLDAYLNAAFLYWNATDFGLNAALHLPYEFIDRAFERYGRLLSDAEEKYPNATEVRFWRLYFDFISLGEPGFVPECEALIKNGDTDVPYFYLHMDAKGGAYSEEAAKLLSVCRGLPTFKNRYISSVIASVAESARWNADHS